MRASSICLEAMEGYRNCVAQTNRAETTKLKTDSKTRRGTCYAVGLLFVERRGKFSVYKRNNEPTFVFGNIKGQFKAIC